MNRRLLRSILIERDMTLEGLAKAIGVSSTKMYENLKNGNFRQKDIAQIKKVLSLDNDTVERIFFAD